MLETEENRLLIRLVGAERSLPREQRQYFYVAHTISSSPGVQLKHPGIPKDAPRVFEGDLRTLASEGLISITLTRETGIDSFYITPFGFQTYQELMQQSGQPIERVENNVMQYLNSDRFKNIYPSAYDKWKQAEELLWGDDTESVFTTIGHLVRETIQEFAEELVQRYGPPETPSDKAKTKAKLRAVLESRIGSKSERQFLESLLAYWSALSDLVQKQEHGAQREKSTLLWNDARRVVFQTAILMFEIDNSLSRKQE